MNLIILGPQGSGKGTQAKLLAERFNLTHISTGEWLRKEINSGSALGQEIKSLTDHGELVSDNILFSVLEKVPFDNEQGFILDGTPRSLAQVQSLEKVFQRTGLQIDKVIFIDLPREESINRMLKRAEIEHRTDDNLDAINQRLYVYEQETKPVVDYYRQQNKVIDIDGRPDIQTIFNDILAKLTAVIPA